jgi:acyl-coenzyme A synthetase/AMP-(fatty) acid ligase
MWQRLFPARGFHLGVMFERAARRRGGTAVTLDRPLDVAPDGGLEHTYRGIADLVDDLAARLWAAGVRTGEHVAVHKSDNFDIALLACAAARIGAVPALLSPTLDGAVVGELVRRLHRPWLVTDRAKLVGDWSLAGVREVAREVLDAHDGPRVLLVGEGAAEAAEAIGAVPLEKFAGAPRRPPVRVGAREPALITHSSGTTGVPKLAVHCPNALWNRLVPQKLMGWPTRGETAAVCMSYVHSRFYHALGVFLHYGSRLLVLVDHDPGSVGPLLARARPGIVETHPNTFVLWEELAGAPAAPLASVRCFGSTFDAIHPRTVQRLLGASQRRSAYLMQLYGQSETGPVAARWFTRRSAAQANGRSVGAALPGFTRLRVVDDAGRRCAPGVLGHIEARTRGRILTYLGAPDRYDAQIDGGWWRMGDVGHVTRWGALHLTDREVDQIGSVDSNLALEDLLMSRLEELREVVIVAGGDGRAVPVICTKGDRPLAAGRWRRATADLPAIAAPVVCRFEDLPRTGTWKIKRLEIARQLGEGRMLVSNWSAS